MRRLPHPLFALLALLLGGCDLLGLEDATKVAAAREAEGKAVGGACRHSGRALEDCYLMNPKAQKAAIYAGWRDMDAYMRENNIQVVRPDLTDAPGTSETPTASAEPPPADAGKKTAVDGKGNAKHSSAAVAPGPTGRRIVG